MLKYDVIIITSYPFPVGLASTNRIKSYAKEIAKTKKVLILTFAQSNYVIGGEKYISGVSDNIDYEYLRPSDPAKKSIISKIFYRIITIVRFYYFLLFKYKTDCIISYFHDVAYTKRLFYLARIRKIRIYKDITETFEGYFGTEKDRCIQKKLQGLFDGLIVMTKEIGDYFSEINHNQFVLPMGVDVDRFSNIKSEIGKYFFYCSGGVLERDGLLDSLNGFLIFSKSHPEYIFKIATPINHQDEYHKKVWNIIQANSGVEYMGIIASTEIPQLMVNSTALVVTPHHDYVTKGFPTKLGEYLASGRPVICTSISSLENNISSGCTYMVSPNRPDEIAEKMEEIVENPSAANTVAKKGLDFVKNKYTVAPYLNELMEFLKLI